jgi:hypothetical protein
VPRETADDNLVLLDSITQCVAIVTDCKLGQAKSDASFFVVNKSLKELFEDRFSLSFEKIFEIQMTSHINLLGEV